VDSRFGTVYFHQRRKTIQSLDKKTVLLKHLETKREEKVSIEKLDDRMHEIMFGED